MWTTKSKIDRFIGELSYPVYLTHVTVLTVLLKPSPALGEELYCNGDGRDNRRVRTDHTLF
jgi:peptidoglycan/LPS O-acetylase OafA/YrhL